MNNPSEGQMSGQYSGQPIPGQETKKSGRGCFFYGCLTAVILAVIAAIAAYIGIQYLKGKANEFVQEYSDTQPKSFPKVEIDSSQYQALRSRVADFKHTLDSVGSQGAAEAKPLVLTATDLNALIRNEPEMKEISQMVNVEIVGDEVRGAISVPLENFGFKDRYMNGEAQFRVSLRDGALFVSVTDVQVKGESLPEPMMQQLRAKNLAEKAHEDPEHRELFEKIKSIDVRDGKIYIVPK